MARVNRTSSSGKGLGQLWFCGNLSGLREGVLFWRRQVIQGFIVDFYCHKAGLVIEVDGDVHDLQKEEDERREKAVSGLCHGFADENGRYVPRDDSRRENCEACGKNYGGINRESAFGGSKSFRDSLWTFTVTKPRWSLKWMAMYTTCRKRKMNGGRRCCPRWG